MQRAHAKVLEAAGILSPDERAAIERGLDRIEQTHSGQPCPASKAEDLHTWIEATLTDLIGAPGKKIHTARSRNDQVATLLVMYVIASGESLAADLRGLIEVICHRAIEWSKLAFPLQTHCQFAAPGNVGFWILRYATAFDGIRVHAKFLVGHWRRFCPLGSGAVAGSSIAIDRRLQATELGFEQPSINALHSTSTRDECLEFLSIAAQTALHLQSLATDVISYSQTPLAWTIYPCQFATGSSMMPNKTNPDAMELLRGECNAISAAHGHATLLLKGLPSGYNRDLQCIKPIMHDTAKRLHHMCKLAAAFIEQLGFDAERLALSLGQGNIDATLQMEKLVNDGRPLREAHQAVAAGLPVTGNHTDAGDSVSTSNDIKRYQTIGSASPAETRRVAKEILAGFDANV